VKPNSSKSFPKGGKTILGQGIREFFVLAIGLAIVFLYSLINTSWEEIPVYRVPLFTDFAAYFHSKFKRP